MPVTACGIALRHELLTYIVGGSRVNPIRLELAEAELATTVPLQ